MKRINYESDFVLQVRLPEEVIGNDFRIELTTNGTNIYVASRINGDFSANIVEGVNPNEYSIILRRHGLGCGRLRMKVYAYYKNVNSPDGKIQEVVPLTNLDVELWAKATDDAEIPMIEIKSGGWGVYDDTELRELTLATREEAFKRIIYIAQTVVNNKTELNDRILELSNNTDMMFNTISAELGYRPTKDEVDTTIKNAITNTLNTVV